MIKINRIKANKDKQKMQIEKRIQTEKIEKNANGKR